MVREGRLTEAVPGSRGGRLGILALRWVVLSALMVAGVASLRAPLPWPWVGCLAALTGIAWLSWAERYRRRKELEESLRLHDLAVERAGLLRRGELHTVLLASLPVGVVAVRSGRPVYANRAAVALLGERVTEVGAPMPTAVRQVIEEASGGRASSRRFTQGFPRRVMEVSARPPGDDGLVVVHLIDVTERWHADRMRQDFVMAASHELKTPVAAIQAAAETVLVALDDDPDAVLEFSGRILDNAIRMSRIVADLLDLSRLESYAPPVEPFDLADLLAEEVRRFISSLPAVEFEAVPTPIVGNPSDLALAFRNLVENAVRHTPDDGWVRVSVGSENGEATVVVADSGSGIPVADIPRIFERFYRVDAARSRATGGTGLGLAIVKHVAELHKGRVEVQSRLGEGSTFRIRVPCLPTDPTP